MKNFTYNGFKFTFEKRSVDTVLRTNINFTSWKYITKDKIYCVYPNCRKNMAYDIFIIKAISFTKFEDQNKMETDFLLYFKGNHVFYGFVSPEYIPYISGNLSKAEEKLKLLLIQ